MKNIIYFFISYILTLVLIMLIIIALLFIDLISINDITSPYISCATPSLDSNMFSYDYNKKSSIFNPFIELFYKNNYYPSYFIKEDIKLNNFNTNLSLSNIILHKQYCRLDYTNNSVNELLNDLAEIIREYSKNRLL
jgi:hypothetical protein